MTKKLASTSLTTLKPSQLVRFLQIQRVAKNTTMIWGAPGIGKSSLVRDFTEKLTGTRNGKVVNYKLVDIRLAQMDQTDLRGIPIPVHEKTVTEVEITDKDLAAFAGVEQGSKVLVKWAAPVFWPTEGSDPTVIFLDELNSAPPTIQAAAYQILLDRGIGEIRFPDDTIIVAAGNRETDRGVTFQLPTPVRNRMSHVELIFDFEEWRVIATKKDYSPLVIGFLSKFPEATDEFDATSADNAFATPRTWEFLSNAITQNPGLEHDELMLQIVAASNVGTKQAIPFVAHVKEASKIPNPEDIFTGKLTTMKNLDAGLQWTLVTMLLQSLRKVPYNDKIPANEKDKRASNFLTFVFVNFSKEFNVLVARTTMKDEDLAENFDWANMEIFRKWAEKYGSYLN